MSFITDYPGWFVLLCALLGAIYAFVLYFRTGKEEVSPWIRNVMMIFRFLSVFIIAFLLLSPLIRKKSEVIDKPLIILAQDNSRSIALSRDSSYYRNQYAADLKKLDEALSSGYEVARLSFGSRVTRGISTSFTENQTDMSELMKEVNNRYSNRNIGAMIIAGDGIYNHGASPFYHTSGTRYPIYTIALGDTTVYRDIILRKINHNRSAYKGDKFPVEVLIDGNRVQGEKTTVEILEDERVVASRPVSFPSERSFQKIMFLTDSKETGVKKYTVVIREVNEELSVYNNRQDFYIEITDTRQKIVFLYGAPHPDIAAMRSALESSARFEFEDYPISEFNQPLEQYDLAVLYQIPFQNQYISIQKFMESDISLLFVLGSQTNVDAFNALKTGLTIVSQKISFTETLPSWNKDFALFTLGKEVTDIVKNFPPLISPFGLYQHSPAAEVAFFQRFGNVTSATPQMIFIQSPGKKTGIIAGENIWKWRLSDYLQTGNHLAFDELMLKTAQFLSVRGDKSFFRVRVSNRFMENEEVVLEAEVFNETYELINDPDVNVTITDDAGKQYPFVMSRSGRGYYLNAGTLAPGTYRYSASVKVGKNNWRKEGSFVVAPLNLEAVSTIADHNLMFRLAKENGGEMVFPSGMKELPEMIRQREDIRPVSYIQKRYTDLTGNLAVFMLILGLLTAEWFLRKRSGNY